MKKVKPAISLVLALSFILVLAACGGTASSPPAEETSSPPADDVASPAPEASTWEPEKTVEMIVIGAIPRDTFPEHISFCIIGAAVRLIGIQDSLPVFFRHKEEEFFHLIRTQRLRDLILDPSLLDAYIYDIRCVGGKRQVTVRLDKQDRYDREQRFPVYCRVLK